MQRSTFLSALLGSFLGAALLVFLLWATSQTRYGGSMMRADNMMGGGRSSMMGMTDQRFIEMMVPHHEDAVAMADIALEKAEHPELKVLARAIKDAQNKEIDDMRAWYKIWYGKELDSAGSYSMMGGMMGTDLNRLRTAKPFDREFIRQMVPHHEMALMMVRMIDNSSHAEIRNLAQNIVSSQSAEIEKMRAWNAVWYPAQ